MSLVNQTAWVVGGVGVLGRGVTRGLLQAGATVIVNSRSGERLERVKESLGNPERLICVEGSLMQQNGASKTVVDALKDAPLLNHVVAHGAVRWWARPSKASFDYYEYQPACDESYALEKIKSTAKVLDMPVELFLESSAQLASLHFSAAKNLMQRLEQSSKLTKVPSTYTFITGDGGGKPNADRTSMGEINSHHVWGLSAALRREMKESPDVCVREVRVGLSVNNEDTPDQKSNKRHSRNPLSEDIGGFIAGLAASAKEGDNGRLIKLEDFDELDRLMTEYGVSIDSQVGSLPHYMCDA